VGYARLRPPTHAYALLSSLPLLLRSCSATASPLEGNLDTNFPAMCGKWSCYAVFVFIVLNFVLSFRGHMRTAGYTDMYTWRISTSFFDKIWSVALCMVVAVFVSDVQARRRDDEKEEKEETKRKKRRRDRRDEEKEETKRKKRWEGPTQPVSHIVYWFRILCTVVYCVYRVCRVPAV
jgi:hypothetical protein